MSLEITDLEHDPFRGEHYDRGGLMIWGFSHHKGDEEKDHSGFTQQTVEELALTGSNWFFNRIRKYFGNEDPCVFWNRVAFANTLPTTVPSEFRYSSGSKEQIGRTKGRIRRILTCLAPRRVVLFSAKGWEHWPKLNGSVPEPALQLMSEPNLWHGTYEFGVGHEIKVYNLPHPQYQPDEKMIERVKHLLNH